MFLSYPNTETETERQRDRETQRQRQRDRETERQRDRETERQRDRETFKKSPTIQGDQNSFLEIDLGNVVATVQMSTYLLVKREQTLLVIVLKKVLFHSLNYI